MVADSHYGSPKALRDAVTQRLRAIAKPHGPWSLSELQRQYAYDRLLARLYQVDKEWIVKGAVALLAREVSVRHSIDIDIFRQAASDLVERDVREAAALDLGDWFQFEIGAGEQLTGVTEGTRYPTTASVGAATWAVFHVDIVSGGVKMTGTPDEVPGVAKVFVPGVEQSGYRVYPLVDHIADKAAAILERHGDGRPSTRFKDLIDLTALVGSAHVGAEDQRAAILSELERRDVQIPEHFDVPDRSIWNAGFAKAVRKTVGLPAQTLDEALAIVRPFVEPVLDGTATGFWDPEAARWG
jgi:Nucleotidyl transferase AbiEii toxin, Type IV TA system